jgi:hypothetical protein
VTDEECIATAMLHGAEFWLANGEYGTGLWYIGPNDKMHPIERQQSERRADDECGFESREKIARAYCEYYKLLE